MIGDSDNPVYDDAIDRAIRDALLADVDNEQVARLEHFWRAQSHRERWWRIARRSVAPVAATIAVVAAGVLIWHREGQRHEETRKAPDLAKSIVEAAPGSLPKKRTNNQIRLANLPGREPTPYEQLVFASRSGVDTHAKTNEGAIDTLIQNVATDKSADPMKLVESSGMNHVAAEALLLRRLPRTPADQQPTILRLLSACGSHRSVPTLLRLARNESIRAQVLVTLEQIVGIDGLAAAVRNSADSNVRSALTLRLLASDSPRGLLRYLSLVGDNATRAEALSAAKTAPNAPVERLITLLDDSDESVRVCAAITLGHINGPETTRMLIARVTEQPAHSREAWLALMECRGDMAREFLAYATRSPQLLGYYNNARVRWAQMIQ